MMALPVKINKTLMIKPKEREIYEMTDKEFRIIIFNVQWIIWKLYNYIKLERKSNTWTKWDLLNKGKETTNKSKMKYYS